MASKNKPKSYTPKDGGALVSRADWPLTGFPNYTTKLDFRRDYDQEIRREGNDWFHPNLDAEIGNQPYPQRQSESVGLTNGGFETDSNQNGIPDGWAVVTSAGIAFARDTISVASRFSGRFRPRGFLPAAPAPASAPSGSFSARFTSTLSIAQGWIETESYMPATPGRSWVLNFQHKVSVANFKVLVEVQWYTSQLVLLSTSTAYSSAADNPTGFEGLEKRVLVPAGAAFGKVRFYGKVGSDPTTGQIWYDGVSLFEGQEGTKPIILLHQARRPNGQTAVIAGTDETLYRWRAEDDGEYIEDAGGGAYVVDGYVDPGYIDDGSDPNYVDDDYITNQEGMWEVVGDNFDPTGERWEAVNINGWAIFNNAADLPQTFRVEDNQVFPNYEMREAGIALVGTITDYVGSLICGDIAMIKEDQMDKLFMHEDSGLATLRQHGAANSSPFTVRALNGGAVDLGASGSGRNVSVPASFQPGTNWCVEAVVKLGGSPAQGNAYTIWGKSECFRFGVVADAGLYYLLLETWHGGVVQGCSSPVAIAPNQWTHVAVVVDPTMNLVKFFIEGESAGNKVGVPSPPDVNANNQFCGTGSFTGGTPSSTGGMQIAELRHWVEKRTDAQIRDYMTADVTGQPKLGGYWKFDETSGTSAADSTGNGHTGTLNAGAVFIVSDAAVDSFLIATPVAATANGLTRSGTTATFVCSAPHKLANGQLVKISGATGAAYNGLFPVTVTSPLSFTYTIVGAPATPDPGSPVMQRALFGTATFNYDGLVGKELFPLNGWRSRIGAVIDPVTIKITRSTLGWTGDQIFFIINDTPILLTGTVNKNGTVNVTGAPETLFTDQLYPGASIMIPGGTGGDEIRVVATITDDHALTVTQPFIGTASIQPARQVSDYLIISDEDYFTPDMVGRTVFFDDGSARKITAYVGPRWAATDSFVGVSKQQFKLENTEAYGAIKNASLYDRVQYRRVWSDIDEPLHFAAASLGTILQGSRALELKHQRRSFRIGDSILIVGAGTEGGNLTATIAYVHPNHTSIILDRAAESTTVEQPVARSDASGNISGFDDLQDDGSPIVKMLDLRGTLVSYKETAIFLTTYTGDPNAPFTAIRRYQGSKTPFYRDTLINVEGRFHLYAGRTSFYSFDLVAQSPQEFKPTEACHDLFYSQVKLDNRKLIFSFPNVLTKEVFFCFPSTSKHKALCYDYNQTPMAVAGSMSTTGEQYTAGAWIKKPLGGPVIGMTEDWVILGGPTGIVMRYGKADDPDEQFGGGKAIFNRLGAGYESRLKGGLYGDRFHETTMSEWMAELATQDYPTVTSYTFNLYGYRNSAEAARLVMTTPLPLPATDNLVPMFFREHYFQDEIVVVGSNNPLRLAARTVVFSKTESRGVQKAGLV